MFGTVIICLQIAKAVSEPDGVLDYSSGRFYKRLCGEGAPLLNLRSIKGQLMRQVYLMLLTSSPLHYDVKPCRVLFGEHFSFFKAGSSGDFVFGNLMQ